MPGKTATEMVTLRMPKVLYRKVERVAAVDNSTLTRIILQAVTEYVGDTCPTCGGRVAEE